VKVKKKKKVKLPLYLRVNDLVERWRNKVPYLLVNKTVISSVSNYVPSRCPGSVSTRESGRTST
jgi:hypothetical protein